MAKKPAKDEVKAKVRKTTAKARKTVNEAVHEAEAVVEKAKKSVTDAVHDAESAVQKAGKKMRASAEHAIKNTAVLNARVIDHAEANAKEAFAAMRKIASASDVKDVVKIQTDFVKEQSARSVAQVREMGEMIAAFGKQALESLRGK